METSEAKEHSVTEAMLFSDNRSPVLSSSR